MLKAKEENNAAFIVCDPRFTRTAAHATEYVRFRPGTDVALIWGILYHIFDNGWEDKDYIARRVWGMEFIRDEVKKWTPEEVEKVTGVPGSQLKRVARTLAQYKPGTLIWCMGGTQHSTGNNNTRAYCVLQLALGNIGVAGGGANIFRGHDNVQGATDFGVTVESLPGYYGLADGAWKHWARVWGVPFDGLKAGFATMKDKEGKDKSLINSAGIPVSRWIDGVLEAKENIEQPDNLRAMVFWGHAPNSQTRLPDMQKAMDKLDLLVVVDPYPTLSAVLSNRKDGVLPAAGGDPVRDLRLGHRVEPLAAVARQGYRAGVGVAARPHHHGDVRQEIRFRRRSPEEHQGERGAGRPAQGARTAGRGHHAGVQPRHVDHRLYRPVAGTPEKAHGQPVHLRPHHPASPGRPVRRRLLRSAVAVLGNRRVESSRHPQPLRHLQTGGRGRLELPRQFRRQDTG
jgi:hypothetical protein